MSQSTEAPPKNVELQGENSEHDSEIHITKPHFTSINGHLLRKRNPLPTKKQATTSSPSKSKVSKSKKPVKKRHPLPTLDDRNPYPGMSQPRRFRMPQSNIPHKGKRCIEHTGPNLGPNPTATDPGPGGPSKKSSTKDSSTQTSDKDEHSKKKAKTVGTSIKLVNNPKPIAKEDGTSSDKEAPKE